MARAGYALRVSWILWRVPSRSQERPLHLRGHGGWKILHVGCYEHELSETKKVATSLPILLPLMLKMELRTVLSREQIDAVKQAEVLVLR